jgi:hypothetical protein
VLKSYGKLPLRFEVNRGQTDARVKFLSRGRNYTLFLTPTEAVLSSRRVAVLRMQLVGANQNPETQGLQKLPGKSHYFIGNDSKKWITNVPMYAKMQYKDVYPGIDLIYYGNQRKLEYDFVVAPSADPKTILLAFKGPERLSLDDRGNLILHMAGGEVVQNAPVVYQEINDTRRQISAGYVITREDQVGFQIAAYDSTKPLIIDPVLAYSTYLGGSASDKGFDIAVDSTGNAYVTGQAESANFPTTSGAFQETPGSSGADLGDAFVTKVNATGSALVYSTYLGGSAEDEGFGIAVDSSDNAYVTGQTESADFPLANPLQSIPGSTGNLTGDAFVTKLSVDGSGLVYSTYLGGLARDQGLSIAVDSAGNAYVTGEAVLGNFPTTAGAAQTSPGGGFSDAFVAKINSGGSALVYSTYLGGNDEDQGFGIAVDPTGNAYVTGQTESTDFPTVAPVQGVLGGLFDGFVTKVNAAGSALVYSTYLGGADFDRGRGIALDSSNNAYVTGETRSSNFPTSADAFDTVFGGDADAFVTRVDAAGSSIVYSTYLGGLRFDVGEAIAVDSFGSAYVTGRADSNEVQGFPITPDAIQSTKAGTAAEGFVTRICILGDEVLFSTFLGGTDADQGSGIAVDASGDVYVTGETQSIDFTTANPLQPSIGGSFDALVAKISDIFTPVDIDIKPGSFPNSINLGSNGNVPVAIFSTTAFDATTVDPTTVTLADAGVKVRGNGLAQASEQDVNEDGLLDLVVHIDTEGLQLTEGDEQATLEGRTSHGDAIQGSDSVRVVP